MAAFRVDGLQLSLMQEWLIFVILLCGQSLDCRNENLLIQEAAV